MVCLHFLILFSSSGKHIRIILDLHFTKQNEEDMSFPIENWSSALFSSLSLLFSLSIVDLFDRYNLTIHITQGRNSSVFWNIGFCHFLLSHELWSRCIHRKWYDTLFNTYQLLNYLWRLRWCVRGRKVPFTSILLIW